MSKNKTWLKATVAGYLKEEFNNGELVDSSQKLDSIKNDIWDFIDQTECEEENLFLNEIINIAEETKDMIIKITNENVNWFYRKSNGLLYFYKHKPSVIKTSVPFSLLNAANYDVIPIKGEKATLLPEKDNNLSYIPKNVLIHRDDLGKYKKED